MMIILTAAVFWVSVDCNVLLGMIFLITGLYVVVQEALESIVSVSMENNKISAISIEAF